MNSIRVQGYGRPDTIIERQGNVIQVSEDSRGMRCGGGGCTVTLAPDSISIRSFQDPDKNLDITFDGKSISVMPPNDGRRSIGGGFAIECDEPVRRQDFERVGLNVAASITGYPLFLAAAPIVPTIHERVPSSSARPCPLAAIFKGAPRRS